MRKGGNVNLDNAEDQNQCFVLVLYARLFGDKGVWRDYQQRFPTLRTWLLL